MVFRSSQLPLHNWRGLEMQYFSPVTIDGQNFSMLFDTGSAVLWVQDESCPAAKCGQGHTRYKASESQTFKDDAGGQSVGLGTDQHFAISTDVAVINSGWMGQSLDRGRIGRTYIRWCILIVSAATHTHTAHRSIGTTRHAHSMMHSPHIAPQD